MMQTSLLILIELQKHSDELYYTIINSIGRGYHYCKSDNLSRTELWMIPKARKEKQKIITQLKAIKDVQTVSLVVIEGSAKPADLKEVRLLFTAYGWDTGSVSDEELILYLDSVFQLKNTYYIDFEFGKFGTRLDRRIFIKKTIDDPDFSASDADRIKKWMQEEQELIPGNSRTIIATDTQTVTITPPLSLHKVRNMNDVQIRKWILKHDTNVKDEDIEIERVSGVLTVTIKSNNGTRTFRAYNPK